MKYMIVNFNDQSLGIIPENWIVNNGKHCLWPHNVSFDIINSYIKNAQKPEDDWMMYEIRIMKMFGT